MNKMISLKSRCTNALSARISALRKDMKNLTADQSGEGYLDMAMKILIIVVIGAAILGVLRNALVLLSVDSYWQMLIMGVVIIGAVTLDQLRHAKK